VDVLFVSLQQTNTHYFFLFLYESRSILTFVSELSFGASAFSRFFFVVCSLIRIIISGCGDALSTDARHGLSLSTDPFGTVFFAYRRTDLILLWSLFNHVMVVWDVTTDEFDAFALAKFVDIPWIVLTCFTSLSR